MAKITQQEASEIAKAFDELRGLPDFVALLNATHGILYKKQTEAPFKLSTLNYFAHHNKNRYYSFEIPKKNGNPRQIHAPTIYLKKVQQCINLIFQVKFMPHSSSHGFLIGRNIVTNAEGHIGKSYIMNVDIKDFFESINFRRIKSVLELPPFNLKDSKEKISFFIANLCCNNGFLPQGSPSSPIITNIICQRLDRKLVSFSKKHKTKYSRYADDITFSSQLDVFTSQFLSDLELILQKEGFILNQNKTRIQDWTQRQEVTGLVVNRKVNVTRSYIKRIRSMLNNYEFKGKEIAEKKFLRHIGKSITEAPSFERSLRGQINYLGMVRGKTDSTYLKYKSKYQELFSESLPIYSFIENGSVKRRLIKDLKKMSETFHDTNLTDEERFTEYCICAFFQIEELINYYLTKIMSFEILIEELDRHTFFKKGNAKGKTDIGQIESVFKVYLFEKYFYYREGTYYDGIITKVRIVRNEGLHRCNILIKQKHIEGPNEMHSFLIQKTSDTIKIEAIEERVRSQLSTNLVPNNLVRLNPSIDPILQNILYEKIKKESIENWVLIDEENGNKNFNKKMNRDEANNLSYSQFNFYFQFENLIIRLDEIFAIWKEASTKSEKASARQMALYGILWLNSLSYKELIRKDYDYFIKAHPIITNREELIESINKRITKVINRNQTLVTYILVKYFKLLTDILTILMTEEEKEKYRRTLSLPTMLELGTRKIDIMIMISMGIPRSIALRVSVHIPEKNKEKPIEWLEGITDIKQLPIKPFYIQHLYRRKYLPGLQIEGKK